MVHRAVALNYLFVSDHQFPPIFKVNLHLACSNFWKRENQQLMLWSPFIFTTDGTSFEVLVTMNVYVGHFDRSSQKKLVEGVLIEHPKAFRKLYLD